MSRGWSDDIEAQPWAEDSGAYRDEPNEDAFNDAYAKAVGFMEETEGILKKAEDEANKLGTPKEYSKTRSRVAQSLEDIQALLKTDRGRNAIRFTGLGVQGRAQQAKRDEVKRKIDDFEKRTGKIQKILQAQQKKQQEQESRRNLVALEDEQSAQAQGSSQAGYGQQQQVQIQAEQNLANQFEVDSNEQLIAQREQEIEDIAQRIGETHDLFQDMALMIREQGEQLDTIEDNVDNTAADTQGAHKNLVQASRYQKNARSKACCLLMILAVVLTIVILAVVVD